jgi:hypothetical protein
MRFPKHFPFPTGLLFAAVMTWIQLAHGQEADGTLAKLEEGLGSIDKEASDARQRLAIRRVIRDAEEASEQAGDHPRRWATLEFLFRARQRLVAIDDDSKYRDALLETCRELVKAPDEFAELKLTADLLLSQVEQARRGDDPVARADALRPFVERYVGTPAGPKALQTATVMAFEFGDSRLISDLRETMDVHYGTDHGMIAFQREKFPGEIFSAPFSGILERSDGKLMRFPMDVFGRSAYVLFWSKEDEGMRHAEQLAKAYEGMREELTGRLTVLSCNLDDLDDAGESIIRGLGMDWPCLHLPGGRENEFFQTYAANDPFLLRLSATAQAAIAMGGVRRQNEEGSLNYESTLGSDMTRPWTELVYSSHLNAMSAGEFLVFDPLETIDPALPPELKARPGATALERDANCVPEETLLEIQACFIAPPMRHQLSHAEQLANLRKAVDLCRKAIAAHPNAPDLWIVRNRLIVALMGLWKTGADIARLEDAFAEAKNAIDAGYPDGCDVVARFCLARQALRDPEADPGKVIDAFVAEAGGENAGGPVFASACMLALDTGDQVRYGKYRGIILKDHTEDPMMWLATSFLLDRYHQYWMFQVPYTFGWIYHIREGNFITDGHSEQANRLLKAELKDADGKPFRIPEDLTADYTAILFTVSPPWSSKREDGLPRAPGNSILNVAPFVEARPGKDVQVCLAMLGEEPYDGTFTDRSKKEVPCTMLAVPGGLENPLVHRLGMPALDKGFNAVLLDKTGRILMTSSGLSPESTRIGNTFGNMVSNGVTRQDELEVRSMIENGEAEAAKNLILTLAPHLDPDAVDEKGRPIKQPEQSLFHLRARTRAYMALEQWDKALADAELVCSIRSKMDADMSKRSKQLDKDEALREEIRAKLAK